MEDDMESEEYGSENEEDENGQKDKQKNSK